MYETDETDIVFIEGIRVETIIGIHDWERKIKQPVIIDLQLATDCAVAAENDDIDLALDYKSITKTVIAFVQSNSFKLVETMAEKTAQLILNDFQTQWVKVRINKRGALRDAQDVGVIVKRSRLQN